LFTLSESAIERIRSFRTERLSRIVSGQTPVQIENYPKVILHIVPLSISNHAKKSHLSENNLEVSQLLSVNTSATYRHYNFDGYIAYSKMEGSLDAPSYVQLFRNGSIEVVWTYPFILYKKEKKIPSLFFEQVLLQKVRFYLNLQKYSLAVEPPIFIMLSLIGVYGYTMTVKRSRFEFGEDYLGNPIDRDVLIIPEIMIEKFEINVDKPMGDIFDVVWNAAGWPASMNYDESGHWNGEKI
jgi:hypothetical protein